jgi:hypothetical protein
LGSPQRRTRAVAPWPSQRGMKAHP